MSSKKIKIYQVDAFTEHVFAGNPAAVCPLDAWPEESLMQNIAAENNLAETAFFVKTAGGYHIRWFTPEAEVDLCGHATLATAYVLFEQSGFKGPLITFESRSGELGVTKNGNWYVLDFPIDQVQPAELTAEIKSCFDRNPLEAYKGLTDYMLVFGSQDDIMQIKPDPLKISKINARGIIVTARGRDVDFVSRFFGPAVGINEDPVTGSAHTTLIPYWSKLLNKTEMTARQLSKRGGFLKCKLNGKRVEISGQASLYMIGEIMV